MCYILSFTLSHLVHPIDMSTGAKSSGKRPVDDSTRFWSQEDDAQELAKVAKADWMGQAGDGGSSAKGVVREKLQKKEEVKKSASSVASKLSAPRASKEPGAGADSRKMKVGSFSAGLSKEKIMESQAM